MPTDPPPLDQSWSTCFACGPAEPHGLQLCYTLASPDELVTTARFDARFQGFAGVIHGGILVTALDDAMANIACLQGETALTAELLTRFLAPVKVDEPVVIRAWVLRRKGKLMECAGQIVDAEGTIRVRAEGKFILTGETPQRRA